MAQRDSEGKFIKGIHYSPNTEFKKGNISWSKGLTKETDEKLMKASENMKKPKNFSEKALEKIRQARLGKHNSISTEFTSERLKQLWRQQSFRDKMKNRKNSKGIPKTETSKNKMSETRKKLCKEGKIVIWNKGKKRLTEISDITIEKLRESSKKLWQNPEYREKVIRNALKGLLIRPTSLERQFIDFIHKYNLSLDYCGNGTLLIGFKNPDFVENNGRKLCVEVGNRAEKSILRKGRPYHSWQEYEKQRVEHFTKYGWKCIVIWEDELKNKDLLLQKINTFIGEK